MVKNKTFFLPLCTLKLSSCKQEGDLRVKDYGGCEDFEGDSVEGSVEHTM